MKKMYVVIACVLVHVYLFADDVLTDGSFQVTQLGVELASDSSIDCKFVCVDDSILLSMDYCGRGGVSKDFGANWISYTRPPLAEYVGSCGGWLEKCFQKRRDLFTSHDKKTLFAVTRGGDSGGWSWCLAATSNLGESWTNIAKFYNGNQYDNVVIKNIYAFDSKNIYMILVHEKSQYVGSNLKMEIDNQLWVTDDAGASWDTISLEDSSTLYPTFFISPETGWVGGEKGVLKKTTDLNNWDYVNSGTENSIQDIFFHDSLKGWFVGDSGTVCYTSDGGVSWKPVIFDDIKSLSVRKIFFIDSDNGWFGGENGLLFKTNDGGNTWQKFSSSTNQTIWDIYLCSNNIGYFSTLEGSLFKFNDSEIIPVNIVNSTLHKNLPSNSFRVNENRLQMYFQLERSNWISVKIFNVSGRLISQTLPKYIKSGKYLETFELKGTAKGVLIVQTKIGNDFYINKVAR